MKVVTIKHLEQLLEVENLSDGVKKSIEILLSAINDWPREIISIDEFEREVGEFISSSTSKQNLTKALISIDLSINAWESEAISQLVEIFVFFDEGITLEEIIQKLKDQISSYP